jgi:hypothetical protein
MVVTEEEYDKCASTHPIFFSNNGDTEVRLDHPGLVYFISGVTGHCQRGQKMTIKVIGPPAPPPAPATPPPSPPSPPHPSGAAPAVAFASASVVIAAVFFPAILRFI